MRKFLAIATAVGLLGLIAPMQVSAQTTPPAAKVTPPAAKVMPAPEAKSTNTKRQVKTKHKVRHARHHRRHRHAYGHRQRHHVRHYTHRRVSPSQIGYQGQ